MLSVAVSARGPRKRTSGLGGEPSPRSHDRIVDPQYSPLDKHVEERRDRRKCCASRCQRSTKETVAEHGMGALTTDEQRHRAQGPVFRLESFHQRREGDDVQEGVEEALVHEDKGVCAVDCSSGWELLAIALIRFQDERIDCVRVLRLISLGLSAAQALMSHALCRPASQAAMMTTATTRVKSGSLNTKDRALSTLNPAISRETPPEGAARARVCAGARGGAWICGGDRRGRGEVVGWRMVAPLASRNATLDGGCWRWRSRLALAAAENAQAVVLARARRSEAAHARFSVAIPSVHQERRGSSPSPLVAGLAISTPDRESPGCCVAVACFDPLARK